MYRLNPMFGGTPRIGVSSLLTCQNSGGDGEDSSAEDDGSASKQFLLTHVIIMFSCFHILTRNIALCFTQRLVCQHRTVRDGLFPFFHNHVITYITSGSNPIRKHEINCNSNYNHKNTTYKLVVLICRLFNTL